MSNKPKLICITGMDGSGKSTVISKLLKRYDNAIECSVWNPFYNPKTKIFESKNKLFNYLFQLNTDARLLFITHALSQSINNAIKSGRSHIFINAYYYKYFSSELCMGADKNLIKNLGQFFIKEDFTVLLNISPQETYKRKQSITKYECGMRPNNENNFINFQSECLKTMGDYATPNWLQVDATQDIDKIIERIKAYIQ